MDKIKKLTSNAWFVPTIILLLVSLLAYFAGPYISFAGYTPLASLNNRIMFITVISFFYLLLQFFKYHQKVTKQKDMVKEISEEAGLNDVINAESTELKNKFEQAFSMLKDKRGGKVSLTELPWYMIIGSPGSGKTTLLANSGLPFPLSNELGNQAVQGVGGTKNCDWWITQDAVLLDTAGRYSSQDSHLKADQSGWHNFLGLIKKYRRKPISGLLVSFSMSDLITMNDYEMSQHTLQLKQRIAEVNDFFATTFPVYIVITKSDMVAGFSQFYETFSHKEREQTFGITFNKDVSIQGDLVATFSNEFAALTQSITRRQWHRMSLERDPNRKTLIYNFSDQFSSLKPTLANIVATLSKKEHGLSSGIIRGLYFTSGTQHGAPIDRMVAKVSKTFGLKNTAKPLWNNDQRSYFIRELLQQVIFPEADQFGVLTRYENRKSLIKRFMIGSATVCTLTLCIGLFISYGNNTQHIISSEKIVDNWNLQYESSVANGDDLRSYIPALNAFASDIAGLVERNEVQFAGLGLDQSDSLQSALTASYKRLLETVLLPYVKAQVELELGAADNISEKYQALKAYLMLASPDERDNTFLMDWLSKNINNNSFFSDVELLELSVHLKQLIKNNIIFNDLDESLVTTTRFALQTQSLEDIYYQQFKMAYYNRPNEALSMANLAGSNWRTVLTTSKDDIRTIPLLFSPKVLPQVLTIEIEAYALQLEDETWILGEGKVIDKAELSKLLKTAYAREYVQNWKDLLTSVSTKPSVNMATLDSALKLTSGIDYPLFNLLNSVYDATKLVETSASTSLIDLSSTTTQNVSDMGSAQTPEYIITSQFTKLHELMDMDQRASWQQNFSSIISEISVAIKFNFKNEQVNNYDDVLDPLEAFGYGQGEPLNRWVLELVDNIKSVSNQTFLGKIEKIWQRDILPQCNSITTSKYPFKKSAQTDASLRDLNALFSFSGSVYQFFVEHIQPLIKSQSYPFRWKENIKQTYGFDEEVLAFFERVSKIRDSLFVADGDGILMNLAFKPIYLVSGLSKFKMSVYGQELSYQYGRASVAVVSWPPENISSSTQIIFVRRDGSEVVDSVGGLFSLFRLIDNAKVKRLNGKKVEVTFSKNNYKAIYEITRQERGNPLIFSELSDFTCPTEF
jgi:type VI secretion system protein ImpL